MSRPYLSPFLFIADVGFFLKLQKIFFVSSQDFQLNHKYFLVKHVYLSFFLELI